LFRTRLTVEIETPALSATSEMVALGDIRKSMKAFSESAFIVYKRIRVLSIAKLIF